jgi:hypothetical protein
MILKNKNLVNLKWMISRHKEFSTNQLQLISLLKQGNIKRCPAVIDENINYIPLQKLSIQKTLRAKLKGTVA